jgi:hypothetical protein
VIDSSTVISYSFAEFINYAPIVQTQPSATFSGSGTTANLAFTTNEQITGEHENIVITWGDGTTTTLSNVAFGPFTETHVYGGNYVGSFTQSWQPYITITNLPNGNPNGNTIQSTSSNSATYTISSSLTPTRPNSVLKTGQYIYLNTTLTGIIPSLVTLSINGATPVDVPAIGSTTNYKYTSNLFGSESINAVWVIDPSALTDTITINYPTKLVPGLQSPYVTALYSNGFTGSYPVSISGAPPPPAINTYPVSITGAPSGTGYYQQMFTFNTSNAPVIMNGLNAQDSNFYITTTSGVKLYSWIESFNATSLTVWSKVPNGTTSVGFEEYPKYFNLLSATGYLGEFPTATSTYAQKDNGYLVFNGTNSYYDNFVNNATGLAGWVNGQFGNANFGNATDGLRQGAQSVGMATTQRFNMSQAYFLTDGYFAYGSNTGRTEIGNLGVSNSFGVIYYSGVHEKLQVNGITTGGYVNTASAIYNKTFAFNMWTTNGNTFITENGTLMGSVTASINVSSQSIGIQLNNGVMLWYYVAVADVPNSIMPTFTTSSTPSSTVQLSGFYQQLFTFNTSNSKFLPDLNAQDSNFLISATNGSPLYSWIEAYNSTSLTVWSKVPNGTTSVNFQVYPQFDNLFSPIGYLGEAPQLSATYAEYDNGKNVFEFYSNFAGTTLSSQWTSSLGAGGSITVNNGITISETGESNIQSYIQTISNFSNPIIVETYMNTSNFVSNYFWAGLATGGGVNTNGASAGYGYMEGYSTGDYYQLKIGTTNTLNGNSLSASAIGSYQILGGVWNATGYEKIFSNYSTVGSFTDSTISLAKTPLSLIMGENNAGTGSITAKWFRGRAYLPNGMPTFSVSTPSVFQANATVANITYQNYRVYTADGFNLSDGEYTYSIPDSFNVNYITVIFNASWTFDYASYVNVVYTNPVQSFITFSDISGIGSITMTFTEPVSIANPVGSLGVVYRPTQAILGVAGTNLPFSDFTLMAGGTTEYEQNFPVIVGQPINITVTDLFGQVIYTDPTYTPTSLVSTLLIPISFTQLSVVNENATYYTTLTLNQNGQNETLGNVMPDSVAVYYIPSATYNVSYSFTGVSGDQNKIPNPATIKNFAMDGLGVIFVQNYTLTSDFQQLNYTKNGLANLKTTIGIYINAGNSNITNLITNLNVSITANNTKIKNDITDISSNLNYVNSTILNEETKIFNNFTIVSSLIKNNNISENSKIEFVNSLINSSSVSITNKIAYADTLVNNSKLSISNLIGFVNDTLNHTNLNLTTKINFLNSLVNNTNISMSDKINFINSTLKDVNLNLTTKIAYTNTLLNNTNINIVDKINFVNTTLKNVNFNITTKIAILNDSLNNVNFNLTTKISFVNSLINSTTISISNKISYVNTLLNNTRVSISTKISYVNSLLNNTQISLSNSISYANTLINDTKLSISTKVSFLNDTLNNLNLNLTTKVAILNTTMNNVNLNATTYFQIEHDVLNTLKANQTDIYHAAEISGAYSYKFIPENATTVSGGVEMQLWVANHDGTIVDNKQLVYFLWENLSAEILALNHNDTTVKPVLVSYNAHYMTVIFPLSTAQIRDIATGANNTLLQLYAPFIAGGVANIATGSISPMTTNIGQSTGIWTILGFSSDPPSGVSPAQFLTWFMGQASGRAIVELIVLFAAIVELLFYIGSWRNARTKTYFNAIYNKIGRDNHE